MEISMMQKRAMLSLSSQYLGRIQSTVAGYAVEELTQSHRMTTHQRHGARQGHFENVHSVTEAAVPFTV